MNFASKFGNFGLELKFCYSLGLPNLAKGGSNSFPPTLPDKTLHLSLLPVMAISITTRSQLACFPNDAIFHMCFAHFSLIVLIIALIVYTGI